ncbi:unnamed protein product, partial [Meganyctiphanes norvegica]
VELQVKLRCEEQERLGPLQHSSSLRRQQRPLSLRPRCRTLRVLHSRRQHHHSNHHHTRPAVEVLPTNPTPAPKTPVDDCHLLGCPATQVVPPVTTPLSVKPPVNVAPTAAGVTSTSSGNAKTRGAAPPRVNTAGRLQRQSRRSKMRRREYRRLRNLLPSLQEKPEVSKVEVVAEAARYIDDLHARLLQRLKTRGLPQQLKDLPIGVEEVHEGNIQDLVRHIMTVTNPASLPPTKIENTRLLPSFIAKTTKHKRP